MNGRIEKENEAREKMEKKLANLPEIFTIFYNWMDAREKTYTTMNSYINHNIEFMKFFTKGKNDDEFYEKVRENDIDRYMVYIRRKKINGEIIEVGDDIRATKWSSLNTFFNFLVQKKYITHNPMEQTERPKIRTEHKVTYLTPSEIQSVFHRIEKDARPAQKNRDMCIVAIGVTTALRVSAIVNINIEDIDFKENTIKVIEKGRKVRYINFSSNLRNFLILWIQDRKDYYNGEDEGPLFISQKKQRMSVDSVQYIVKKYTSHLPKHLSPHKLRSSAAMNLIKSGANVTTVQSVLGHSNLATTQRYVTNEEKEKAVSTLDNLI